MLLLYHSIEGLSVITVNPESEARGRGQLSFDNPMLPWYNYFIPYYNTEHELVSRKYRKKVALG